MLWPMPVGAVVCGGGPTVAGSAWPQAATQQVESSARARTSSSHCSRLPGPAPQEAGSSTTCAPWLARRVNSSGKRTS